MKKSIIISTLLIFSFVFAATVGAQGASTTTRLKNLASSTIGNACQVMTQKIDINVTKFDNNKSRHDKVFNGMETKMGSIIKSLEAKGVDVGNLKADLAVLSEKVDKFEIDYQAYHEILRATKEFACGQSSGNFVNKVAEARKLLPALRKDILDIRSFYQNTIRPDIIALRNELKAMKTNSSSTSSTLISQ